MKEELLRELEESKARIIKRIDELLDKPIREKDDYYPTEAALEIIRIWHWSDARGWFKFIREVWHLGSWCWSEGEETDELDEDKKAYVYNISTAGWSGNESIIHAMQKNMMWHLNWVQSRRGGHYIFELKEFQD